MIIDTNKQKHTDIATLVRATVVRFSLKPDGDVELEFDDGSIVTVGDWLIGQNFDHNWHNFMATGAKKYLKACGGSEPGKSSQE